MTFSPLKTLTGACLGLMLAIGSASAHDIWITLGSGQVLLHYGHPHDRQTPDRDKLLDLGAFAPTGSSSLLSRLSQASLGGHAVLAAALPTDAAATLVAASYDNGYWVKAPDGSYRNTSRRLVPQAQDSLWSVKFAKAALGPDAPFERVVGHELEIVPLSRPGAENLRVRVLFRGQPLAGAEVAYGDGITPVAEADISRAKADDAGVATIPIRRTGPHVLTVSRRVAPSVTPALADADLFTATFSFETQAPTTN